MRRDLTKADVPWSIRVPKIDKDTLVSLLPMQGAQTWVVQRGLEAFLSLMEDAPHLRHWAREQITEMLYGDSDSTRAPMADLNIRIPTDLYVRFSKTFPEFGAATWFTRRFIHQLGELLRDYPTTEELISIAVNHAMSPTVKEEASND